MLDVLAEEVCEGDYVVLSGSLPAGVDRRTYGAWTRTLRHAGAHVYLDADGDALEGGLKGKPFFTKPNNHELSALVGRELTTVEEIAAAAHELVEKGVERVVVSMGGEGALLATAGETWHASSVKVPVGSTVGRRRLRGRSLRLRRRAGSWRRGYAPPRHGDGRRQRHGVRHAGSRALRRRRAHRPR